MDNEDETSEQQKLYDCCICQVTGPATNERPIGIVTLLQPTSGKHLTSGHY